LISQKMELFRRFKFSFIITIGQFYDEKQHWTVIRSFYNCSYETV
jgi:hypothetical protein